MLISECLTKYLRYHKLQLHSSQTIGNYRLFLNKFLSFCGDIDISLLNSSIVLDYHESLVDKGIKKASVATYLRHLKAFIRFCEDSDYIPSKGLYRCIRLPRQSKKEVYLFSAFDIDSIIKAISGFPEWIEKRNKAIFALLYDSGLRVSEVCNVLHKDIFFDSHSILVHGKGDKERYVPLGSFSELYLRDYMAVCPHSSDYVFMSHTGLPLTSSGIKTFMNRLKHKTGFHDLSCHKLRHNFATNYCLDAYSDEGYVDTYKLRSLMGHEKIETTELYLHMAQGIIAKNGFRSHLDSLLKNQGFPKNES